MKKKISRIFCCIVFVVVILSNNIYSKGVKNDIVNDNSVVYPYYRPMTSGFINFYQEYISPANQATCPMYPTDSRYAKGVFREYNPLVAILKTSDRLIRCGNDLTNYDTVNINGFTRYADPVSYDSSVKTILSSNSKQELSMEDIKDYKDISAKLLYEFAKELEVSQEYERAIIEYKRLLSYYPQSQYRINALKSIFNIFYQQEKYIEAISFGKKIIKENDSSADNLDIKFLIGASYFRIANFTLARNYFKELESGSNLELKYKAYLLDGLSFAQQERWDEAKSKFSKVDSSSKLYSIAQKSMYLADNGKYLKYKNPQLAGVLGVIPGLGYWYSGYKKSAMSAFVLNSLFILSAAKSFENNNDQLGVLLGAFGLSFYAGNIYGSVQTAERTNKKIKRDYLLNFKFNFKY